jgi:hypothetical protein
MSNEHFEGGERVPICEFDHSSLDSPEDIMREKLEMGMAALEICEEFARESAREQTQRMMRKIVAALFSEERPKFFIFQLAWLSGYASNEGFTLPELAAKSGVSKQAFEQACERTAVEFKFPKTSMQRSDAAKANMSAACKSKNL